MNVFLHRSMYIHYNLKKATDKAPSKRKSLMMEMQTLCHLGARDIVEGKGNFLRAFEDQLVHSTNVYRELATCQGCYGHLEHVNE